MCAQYNQTWSPEEIADYFAAQIPELSELEYSQTMFPKQKGLVVYPEEGRPTIKSMEWGLLPAFAKDHMVSKKYATFNARSEGVPTSRLYAPAFKQNQRCIIPVNSFVEWTGKPGEKQKVMISKTDEPLFGIAGLWNFSPEVDGKPLWTFTMLTTTPTKEIKAVHSRMPLALSHEDCEPWLAGDRDLNDLSDSTKDLHFNLSGL